MRLTSSALGLCFKRRRSHGDKHLERKRTMTQRATTSLSLHYQVKAGQREGLLLEIKGMLDRCAKEPEFITGILHETPERPNQFVKNTRDEFRLLCTTVKHAFYLEKEPL